MKKNRVVVIASLTILVLSLFFGSQIAMADPLYEYSPHDGDTVSGTVDITVKVLDDQLFARIKDMHCTIEGYDANGNRYNVDILSIPQGQVPNPVVFKWDTDAKKLPDGQYNISVQVIGDDTIDPQNPVIEQIDNVHLGAVFIRNHQFPNDHTPPTVHVTWPAPGTVIKGQVEIKYIAEDNESGIDSVQLYLMPNKDTPIATVYTNHPEPLIFDTTRAPDGDQALLIRATDRAGNISTNVFGIDQNAFIVYTIVNHQQIPNTSPFVKITSPLKDDVVGEKFTVTGEILLSDIKSVFVSIPRTNLVQIVNVIGNSNKISTQLNTKDIPDGTYALQMQGLHDGGGMFGPPDQVRFTIDKASSKLSQMTIPNNPGNKYVTITDPQKGQPVNSTWKVKASVSDDADFSYLSFQAGNKAIGQNVQKGSPYEIDWDTTEWQDGPVFLEVLMFNGQGLIEKDSVLVTVQNGQGGGPQGPQMIKPQIQDNGQMQNNAVQANSDLKGKLNQNLLPQGNLSGQNDSVKPVGIQSESIQPHAEEPVTAELSEVKLDGENLEDVSHRMSFEDLKGKPIVLTGNLKDAASVDHLEVSLDGGSTWQKIETAPKWSFNFNPVPNQDYDIKFRAIGKNGKTSDIKSSRTRFEYTREEHSASVTSTASLATVAKPAGMTAVSTGSGQASEDSFSKSIGSLSSDAIDTTPKTEQKSAKGTAALNSIKLTENQ